MKKYNKFLAALTTGAIALTSTLSVSAYWRTTTTDAATTTYWVREEGEEQCVKVYKFNTPENMFHTQLDAEEEEEGKYIVDYEHSICVGNLVDYKMYLVEKGYDFNEEEIQILFDDYRARWIDWAYDSQFYRLSLVPSSMFVYTDKNVELHPSDFNCPIEILYVDYNTDLLDYRTFEIDFSNFDDLYAAEKMLLETPGVRKVNFCSVFNCNNFSEDKCVIIDDDGILLNLADLAAYGFCEIVNLDALNKVAYSYDISDYSYKSTDVVMLAKYISGKFSYDDETARAAADLSGDSALNSEDLLLMIKKLTGEI